MSYEAGRHQMYVDLDTAAEDYTTAVYDSMATPAVNWFCSLYGMVVFSDLTVETSKGHRYFIGFDGAEHPSFAIGWAAGNTNTDYRYLWIVFLLDGQPLASVMDATGTGTMSSSTYAKMIIQRHFTSHDCDFVYLNYIKSTNFSGISNCFCGSTTSVNSANWIDFAIIKTDNNKTLPCYRESGIFKTYEYNGNGSITQINPNNPYFGRVAQAVANSDFYYIAQKRLEHNVAVVGLFLYSGAGKTVGNIYKINGEYYMCFKSDSADDGSYMMKLPDYTT